MTDIKPMTDEELAKFDASRKLPPHIPNVADALRERVRLADNLFYAAEAFELDALKRGVPSEKLSAEYSRALAAYRAATGGKREGT